MEDFTWLYHVRYVLNDDEILLIHPDNEYPNADVVDRIYKDRKK